MGAKAVRGAKTLGVALLAVSIAAVFRAFCYVVFDETIPYTPFYPAIVLATMYGRARGGAVAIVLAAFAASFFWLLPYGRLVIEESTDTIGLVLFILVSTLIVALCEAMRRSQDVAHAAAKERQKLLVHAQAAKKTAEDANRLKDVLLASVSHELRTPLQAILGWAQILLQRHPKDEDTAKGLAIIANSAKIQAYLVEDLLDMSRIAAGKMRLATRLVNPQCSIDAAIQTVGLAAKAKQIKIVRAYDADACALNADPDRLQQIIWNLLSNSIKFSSPNSTITVSLERVPEFIQFRIKDEGIGISPEFLPNIFELFRQEDGSHVRQHSGLGSAESAGPGTGTTMTILLPDLEPAVSETESSLPSPQPTVLSGVRVLVVDDDVETCEVVRRILHECDAEVAVANGVDQALDVYGDFHPSVIVSDIGMPKRDGFELLREIRVRSAARRERVSAMALTAYSGQEDRRRAFQAGFQLHLGKPFGADELREAVAELAAISADDRSDT